MRWGAVFAVLFLLPACRHQDPPAQRPDVAADAGTHADAGAPPIDTSGWWRDRVFYEVFVRSFQDSNGDGIGDLAGLTARLDELNDGDPSTTGDLGITGLWLMPIHPSPSYHGYDVVDYRGVNPQYGTMADLEAFLAAAHRRGIKVIIDFVLNHSSREHAWFQDSRNRVAKRDWYLWRNDNPGWTQPWGPGPVWHPDNGAYYYGIFWSGMPDLNLGNPEVEAEMIDSMKFWLAKGIDGFRVDAARHFFESSDGVLFDQPESHALVKRLRAALAPEFPDALLVAEAWTNMQTVAQYYGDGDEFQLAFGFDTAAAIKQSARDGLRSDVNQNLAAAETTYRDRGFEAPFLANHDMERVMRFLGGDSTKMRPAAFTLLGLPGTPFLYYGEEIGMMGGAAPRDEDKRTPMRWSAAAPGFGFTTGTPWHTAAEAAGVDVESQRATEGSLWRLFRDLIAARSRSAALSRGETSRPKVNNAGRGVSVWLRTSGNERVLCVVNFDAAPSAPFTVELAGTPRVLFGENTGTISTEGGVVQFAALGARGFVYVALE